MAVLASGTKALSVTAAAVANQPCHELTIHNEEPAGGINLKVGNATAQNFTVSPLGSVKLMVTNANQVYVKSASGTPNMTWIAT